MNETLYLEATGAAAQALTPGAVLRALAVGAGVFAEEVTTLEPLGARRVAVTLTGARARALATPRGLVDGSATGGVGWTLRRPEDPPEDGRLVAFATWHPAEAPAAPTPGAISRSPPSAIGPDVGAEELGVGLVGPGFAQLLLPARLALLGLPEVLTVPRAGRDGETLRVALHAPSAMASAAGSGAP